MVSIFFPFTTVTSPVTEVASDRGKADLRLPFAADEQNAIESNRLLIALFPVDADDISRGDFVLPTAIINDCVHLKSPSERGAGILAI